jgi:hypothetical protein
VLREGSDDTVGRLTEAVQRVDQFLTLEWLWQRKLRRAERKLAAILASEGERSFATLSATADVRRAQFAIEYGRAVKPDVQQAVLQAARAGVPKHVLRVMVINLDIRADKKGRIFVRRDWWQTALAWISRILVVVGMGYMSLHILAHPADRHIAKVLLLLLVGAVFFAVAYVWDLFGVRAVRAARGHAQHIEAANPAKDAGGAVISSFAERRQIIN